MPKDKPLIPTIRVNYQFPQPVVDSIRSILLRIHATSDSEVVRRSVYAFDFITAQMNSGDEVIIRKADGTEVQICSL